jgi:diaminopimelate decarboxylase
MPVNLRLALDQLEQLTKKYPSFYIYDADMISYNATQFLNTFRKHIPNFEQYFAVKALPNPAIMKILQDCGMGFDCSSKLELIMAKQLGSNKIMYTSNFTSVEDLEFALSQKVIINLDDIDGLENLKIALDNTKAELPELICFRLNPCHDNIGKIHSEIKSNVLGGPDTKFGIPDTKIVEAYEKALNMGFKKFGIHVMTGSCIMKVNYWKELIYVVFDSINNIYQKLGITFEFLDLGGGIGIPYKPHKTKINIDYLADIIAESINENIVKYDLPFKPNIIMENGRYITGPYGWLISKCKSIKSGFQDKKFYGLNVCMAQLMRPGMYNAYHHITVPRLEPYNKLSLGRFDMIDMSIFTHDIVNVVGTLCENNDWFAKNRPLPKGIKKEDIFIIYDCGAHCISMSNNYNGNLRPPELLLETVDNKLTIRLIKHGETDEYILKNFT